MRQEKYNKKLESIYYVMDYLNNQFEKRNLYENYKKNQKHS